MKDKETQNNVFDILDKFEFFQGQRAGRELWNDKPKEVQDKDIADFIKDINYIRSYLQDSVVLSREEYEKLRSLYDCEQGSYMTSSIGDLPLTVEGLRKAVDEITRLNRVEVELQELNAKYYNEAKDSRRELKQARKETAEKILNYLELSGIDTALFNTKIKPYVESMYGIDSSCKPIVGFDNYVVSNKGIVINTETNEIKAQFLDTKGYPYVTLCKNGKLKSIKVHRLVAMAFIDNTENKPEINHINGIKTDNRVENLEWCTSKENSVHKTEVLGKGNIRPVRCVETGIIYRSGLYASKLCKTSSGAISNSCNDKSRQKTAGGYHWEHIDEVEIKE